MPPPPPSPPPSESDGDLPPATRPQGLRQPSVRPPASPAPTSAGWLVFLGGVLVVVGVFLPWIQASAGGQSVSVNGITVGTYGTLILGGFALARGASMLWPQIVKIQLGTPLIGGVLILVLLGMRWGSIQQTLTDVRAQTPGVNASIGIGVYAVIAGAVLVLAGGAMTSPRFTSGRRARR